ncbi:hypothetical protein BC830DRAFT_1131269 [Chytriomyces sp. MP71]|nr:hypothetical protein BC830DRAFT_1131269 [Chytriomyces sp. MP71]
MSSSDISENVRSQQEALGEKGARLAGEAGEGMLDADAPTPELEVAGPSESPLTLLTPLSMMASNAGLLGHGVGLGMYHQQQQQQQQAQYLHNPLHPAMYQQHMEQLSVAAKDMLHQQQHTTEEFSTFFNIGEVSPSTQQQANTAAFLQDTSAFMPPLDEQQRQQLYSFTFSSSHPDYSTFAYDASNPKAAQAPMGNMNITLSSSQQ